MNHVPLKRALSGLIFALLVFGLVGCDMIGSDDGDFSTDEVQDLYASISSELSLSSVQQASFGDALRPHDREDRTPGYLWTVAAELSQTLDDDQKQQLLERTPMLDRPNPFRGLMGHPGGGGYYGVGGLLGGSGRHGIGPGDDVLGLTDEQQEALAALHETFREEVRALRDAHHSGELGDEDYLAQMMALHESRRADFDALLTDDQRAALDAFRADREAAFEAFREEVRAVRDEVLGLTAEQSEAFDAIHQDQLDAREVLVEQLLAGEITRAEWNDEVDALLAARQEALQALLDDAQYDIVQIHDALAVRHGKRGHRGRHGPPGR